MRLSRRLSALYPALLALLAACSSSDETEAPCDPAGSSAGLPLLGADCDPLVPTQCGFPFPSNVFLVDDPASRTGKHVAFGAGTLPAPSGGEPIDPLLWADHDGFSPGATIVTHLPGATIAGLPTQDTLERSLADDSPTVVIDAETGERVAHFAELDESILGQDAADKTFMIRPVVRLRDATRYIVAVRRVVDGSGRALAPTPVFQALRDGGASCDPSVERRRALYGDIFARLEAAGVAKGDLQIAWDFSTASRENNTERLLRMRDEALATVGDDGPAYVIDGVDESPNPRIRRRIRGTMTVPLYTDIPGPGAKLFVGDDGMPRQNGTADYPFVVHIPNAVADGEPGALLQNGHGLIGAKEEGQDDYLAEIADVTRSVAFSVDFVGMAHDDLDPITQAIVSNVALFKDVVGRQHQGLLNSLLAMRLMRGRFVDEPLVQFNGHSAIDPTRRYYRGDSQGGIFGATYMAVSTDVTRGLVSVPGMTYSLLLNRSADFGIYFVLLKNSYETGHNIQLMLGLFQMMWDRTEPNGYAPYIAKDTLPGTPAHAILIHAAIGDHQVTPLGAHLIARAVGAKNVAPVNRSVWGIEEATPPFQGSALVELAFGAPEAPKTNTPPSAGNDPHGAVRALPAAYLQADHFFRTGEIVQTCAGACDPE